MDSEFAEYVKNNIREYLPESYANAKIQIQQTIKGNDRVLDSLTVQREGEDFAVAIHLNSLEQEYQNGESMHEIMVYLLYQLQEVIFYDGKTKQTNPDGNP